MEVVFERERGASNLTGRMAQSSGTDGDQITKRLEEELEVINKRGNKGKTIENAKTYEDISSAMTREQLFKLVKELYSFSKRSLEHTKKMKTGAKSSSENNVNVSAEDIGKMIRDQLSGVLPGMLKDALSMNQQGVPKTTSGGPATKSDTMHTLEIKKKVDASDKDNDSLTMISDNDWTTVVRKDVKGALKNVPIIKASTSQKTTAKLHFESKDHLDQAKQALQQKYEVTSRSEEKKKLNPKITVSDIDADITDEATFMDELVNKNPELKNLKDEGEDLKMVFFDKKDGYCVLQVSARIREAIRKDGDKVAIGFQKHTVKDRFHVLQCFHCQEFGHKAGSDFCKKKDEDPTCFYCAGRHSSKECTHKKTRKTESIKCSNCCHSKNPHEKKSSGSHKASDTLCPAYVRERARVMSRTAGCDESKNLYLEKVRETKRRLGRV